MVDDSTRLISAQPLPVGHDLLWYKIESILGQGGFGITYLAIDSNLNRKVAIKEYLPTSFAYRHSDLTVAPLTGEHGNNYSWGLESFLNEARTLAKFKHRNIVQVQTVFEEHNTAYMVMEYESGVSLLEIFKNDDLHEGQSFYENILFPVMDGLQSIHDAGFIHRDIKPANIYLRSDGSPVLIDFGSARQTSQQDTGEMTTLVSQGYTPLEQYSSNFGNQGPWTDIYSMAASVYHGMTGRKSMDALNRSAGLLSGKGDPHDSLESLNLSGFDKTFIRAIDQAMQLKPESRPQSLAQWRSMFQQKNERTIIQDQDDVTRVIKPSAATDLNVRPRVKPDAREKTEVPYKRKNSSDRIVRQGDSESDRKKSKSLPLVAGLVLLLATGVVGWWFIQSQPSKPDSTSLKDTIAGLPKTDIEVITPDERIRQELSELRSIGSIYLQAENVDPDSPLVRDGIDFVVEQYEKIWKRDIVVNHGELFLRFYKDVESVAAVSDRGAKLFESFSYDSAPNWVSLKEMLSNTSLSSLEQQKVIVGISGLSPDEKKDALNDPGVAALTSRLTQSVIDAINDSDYASAARMMELGMMLDPTDENLVHLRQKFN